MSLSATEIWEAESVGKAYISGPINWRGPHRGRYEMGS